jgi:ABC-type sugar transport system ATPase subunit
MAELRLRQLTKAFGGLEVIKGIDLDIGSGEFVVFVGPSGCGKSTVLRMIAGLEGVTSGTIEFDGEVVNDIPPALRAVAMVFQTYALYPHMTVYNNIAFGMKLARTGRAEIDKRVRATAEVLQLTPFLDRLPRQLSGGQRQRVAIGRAIVRNPRVFLFDEPLSNLDAALRVSMRIEIARLHESMPGITMVYVTHDQVEAMTLADRIVVLHAGAIEQVGPPMELYEHPANLFVARFIGSPAMNTVPCLIAAGGLVKTEQGRAVRVAAAIPPEAAGKPGTLGVRPEDLVVTPGEDAIFEGRVDVVEHLGEMTVLYVDCGHQEAIIAKLDGNVQIQRNARVALTAPLGALHVFDQGGRAFRRDGA